jgi:hypothetical protein
MKIAAFEPLNASSGLQDSIAQLGYQIHRMTNVYIGNFSTHSIVHSIFALLHQKSNTSTDTSPYAPPKVHTDGAVFVVHRQPIALDRMTVHDVRQDLTGEWVMGGSGVSEWREGCTAC